MTLVAVERHRIAHGSVPDSVASIDPRFRRGFIGDPYIGAPVRFKAMPARLLLYTVGEDGRDNGGNLPKKNRPAPGTDWGMTFWDVAERAKPPTSELPDNVFQTIHHRDEADSIP